MKVEKGDVLDYIGKSDIVCVTTNSVVKANGELVMGAGCALAFKKKFPELPKTFGSKVKVKGNRPVIGCKSKNTIIVSFPTKYHYSGKSDLELIKNSARVLVQIADFYKSKNIYIPSPGTGLGKLSKEEVYKELSMILDDRFIILEL